MVLPPHFHIAPLTRGDTRLASILAQWYYEEWKIPQEGYMPRLLALDPDDMEIHLVLFHHDQPIAAGGIHHKVGLLQVAPEFAEHDPWVAVLYTLPAYRKQGLGAMLLQALEDAAAAVGYTKLYLYTHTAENLYKRQGWTRLEYPAPFVAYKGSTAVVMEKAILANK